MKVGLCSKILQERSLDETIREAGRIGYEGMEVFGVARHLPPETDVERAGKAAGLAGELGVEFVTLCSYVGGFDKKSDEECEKEVENFCRYVELARVTGSTMIRVTPAYVGHEGVGAIAEDEKKRFAEWTRRCAELAREHELRIVLENNLSMIATVKGTVEVLELIGADNVGVNYDPGNIFRVDEGYGWEAVKAFGERIFNVQIKDVRKEGDDIRLLLGEGDIAYRSVIEALNTAAYEGFVTAECHREPDDAMSDIDIAEHEFEAITALLE